MTPSPIDWAYWKNQRFVKVWEAVLLSVGINPRDEKLNLADTLANHREVKRRMERMLSDLSKPDFFSVKRKGRAHPIRSRVDLKEAAAWFIQSQPPLEGIPPHLGYIGEQYLLAQQEARKKHSGRYTLEEAAEKLAAEAGERPEVILQKLKAAALNGSLPVHEPGRNARYEYGPGQASQVHEFYEEAYWSDLNEWLNKHEPQIQFRFPISTAEEMLTATSPPPVATPPLSRHVSQELAIMNAIRGLGFEPTQLPTPHTGKPGVKAAVKKGLNFSESVFQKAWERLRYSGQIANK